MAKTSKSDKSFPIVAIGASAGGLTAFEDLLNALPSAPGAAFVLVPHLAPQFKSHLTEILARRSKLPIKEVKGGDRVTSDRIYILPPNRAMQIKGGVLHLSSEGRESQWRKPIDSFFRSLAADQRQRAVGVLLSGEGSDGTEGLRAIKEQGGITFAQNAATAAHLSMPQSAAVAGAVDFILSPAQIGKRLGAGWAGLKDGRRGAPVREKPALEGSLDKILELLRTSKGVEFALYKRNTLRRRIQRRMELSHIPQAEKYLRALKADPEELERLYRDVLISVTSFFREPDSFSALKTAVYPRLVKNRPADAAIRVWVPGCSTGEEAYSHAMNLVEFLGERAVDIPFQIFATDVNAAVIAKARLGVYSEKIKNEMSPERLHRFFVATEDGYRIAPFIRERCIFAAKNLLKDPPFTNLDLISCRNLLIYLGPALQAKALQIFQYALKPRGILMLGRSENIGDFSGRFSALSVNKKIFSERTGASRARLEFLQPARFLETESAFKDAGAPARGEPPAEAFDLQGALDGVLPPRYIPNGVIVNDELEILRFLGQTAPYLRPAPGKPSMNLRRMASGDLLLELRAAIHVAKKTAAVVRKEVAAPGGVPGRLRVEVLPIPASALNKDYFLVLFEDAGAAAEGAGAARRRHKESRRVIDLREDLAVSREHLKSIIEEQEATNERLKASNEELLSSNEELQSINEEFETSKEELQSTNEELITSTEELGRTNQTLNGANNDLSNLLANINIPIVLLGADLTVRRFTPAAEKALGLSAEKIGRSIAQIKLPLRLPQLKSLLLRVISGGQTRDLEVQDLKGYWYRLFLRPYRTDKRRLEKSRIEGAVLALVDIHDHKLAELAMLRLATLVHDSNDAVVVLDLKDRIITWNRGAEKMYGYTEAEALGMKGGVLVPEDRRQERRVWLERLLSTKEASVLETQRRAKDGRILDVLVTSTVLLDERGKPIEIATTAHDFTERKRSGEELRTLYRRVVSAQETERMRVARELHDGVGQILSGVKFRLEALPGRVPGIPDEVGKEIAKASAIIDRAISETRRVSQNLMPTELEDLGLQPALKALCRDFQERLRVPVTLKCEGLPRFLDADAALALFRIAQEALSNAGKHARAKNAALSLTRKGNRLELSVSDDGKGFTAAARARRARRGGVGLANIEQRAEAVGGTADIRSAPGKGTLLTVRVPLSAGDAVK